MKTTRAMVPVLLCFDVRHADDLTPDQIAEVTRLMITHNLGKIGDETPTETNCVPMMDESGCTCDAVIYPSDHTWCDTMAFAHPNAAVVPAKKTPLELAQEIVAGGNGQGHSYFDLYRNAKAVSERLIEMETRQTPPKALTARAHIIATDEDVRINVRLGTETPEAFGPYPFGPTGADLQKILEALGIDAVYTYKGRQG